MQAGVGCFCGNDKPTDLPVDQSECSTQCLGDTSQICGGPWRSNVYENHQETKSDDSFKKIFSHNTAGRLFSSQEDALNKNPEDPNANLNYMNMKSTANQGVNWNSTIEVMENWSMEMMDH